MADTLLGEHRLAQIVQDQHLVAEIDRQHGMRQVADDVLHHHHAQLVGAQPEQAQRAVFGDDVVLAVAGAAEELERRRPIVAAAVIVGVGPVRPAVDEAVDRLDLRTRCHADEAAQQSRPGQRGAVWAVLCGGGARANDAVLRVGPLEHAPPLRQGVEGIDAELRGAEQAGRGRLDRGGRHAGGSKKGSLSEPAQVRHSMLGRCLTGPRRLHGCEHVRG